nr:unnamed protein product [Digitaria exilis]
MDATQRPGCATVAHRRRIRAQALVPLDPDQRLGQIARRRQLVDPRVELGLYGGRWLIEHGRDWRAKSGAGHRSSAVIPVRASGRINRGREVRYSSATLLLFLVTSGVEDGRGEEAGDGETSSDTSLSSSMAVDRESEIRSGFDEEGRRYL